MDRTAEFADSNSSRSQISSARISGTDDLRFDSGKQLIDINILKKPRLIIDPRSVFKISWDVNILVLDLIVFIVTPITLIYEGSFGNIFRPHSGLDIDIVGVIFDVFFIADIFLTFFSASTDPTIDFVHHRKNYFYFWFWVDFLSTVPSFIHPAVRLLRVLDLFRLWQHLRHLITGMNIFWFLLFRLLGIMLLMILLVHLFGCFWIIIGLSDELSWIDEYDFHLRQDPIGDQLAVAYYFVVSSFTLVGSEKLRPVHTAEIWFATLMCIVGVLMTSYIIAVAASIISAMGTAAVEQEYKIKQALILWLQQFGFNISQDDAEEAMSFFKGVSESTIALTENPLTSPFIAHLPPHVRMKLCVAAFGPFIDSYEKFLEAVDATDAFVEDFLSHMKKRVYHKQGDDNAMVINIEDQVREVVFIMEGSVILTAVNAQETNKGLQLETGFWYGGHQSTEEFHPSPIQVEVWGDSLAVYYIEKFTWIELLDRHPSVATHVLDVSRRQTYAILDHLKVPNAEAYICGRPMLKCFTAGQPLFCQYFDEEEGFPVMVPAEESNPITPATRRQNSVRSSKSYNRNNTLDSQTDLNTTKGTWAGANKLRKVTEAVGKAAHYGFRDRSSLNIMRTAVAEIHPDESLGRSDSLLKTQDSRLSRTAVTSPPRRGGSKTEVTSTKASRVLIKDAKRDLGMSARYEYSFISLKFLILKVMKINWMFFNSKVIKN
eukprot:GHVL01022996.1.p1 GENE.GHVL01022996.1~~GHVL01022996.1.p1  ORF type:complete len:716 (+),score=107.87 GHVL01022996.1:31-2178(+)